MLVYDLADSQELQGFVRGIQEEVERNRFTLSNILPNDNIDEIEWRVTTGSLQDQDAAKVRQWDTESPIGNRQGVKRLMGELPPISKKIRLGEEERLRKRALERQDNAGLVAAIYDDAGNMARAVLARVELMRGEALEKGSITLNENGVQQTVDFQRAAGHNVIASEVWTDPTSDIIGEFQSWLDTYYETNGVYPGAVLVNKARIANLQRNEAFRALLGNIVGTPSLLTIGAVNQVFDSFDFPPLLSYNTKVRVDGSQVNVIDPTKVILLPPAGEPLGRTFFGTTAESIELVEANQIANDQAPGLVSVVDKTYDPVATWTKSAAIALATLMNPDLTFVAKVA